MQCTQKVVFFSMGMYSCICIHKVRGQKDKVRGQKNRFPRICIYIWYIYVYCDILIPLLTWLITIAFIPLWFCLWSTSLKGNKASLFLQPLMLQTLDVYGMPQSWILTRQGMGWVWMVSDLHWNSLTPKPVKSYGNPNQPTETSIDSSKTWLCNNFPVECYERCDLGLHWLPFSFCVNSSKLTRQQLKGLSSMSNREALPYGLVWDWRTVLFWKTHDGSLEHYIDVSFVCYDMAEKSNWIPTVDMLFLPSSLSMTDISSHFRDLFFSGCFPLFVGRFLSQERLQYFRGNL